jgi:23S rRNA (adenine2503-C2)-methyltransferase
MILHPFVTTYLCGCQFLCSLAFRAPSLSHKVFGGGVSGRQQFRTTVFQLESPVEDKYSSELEPSALFAPLITPLSLSLEDLSSVLGGKGRAQACWDCFRNGVDPRWLYACDDDEDSEPLSVAETDVSSSNTWKRSKLKSLVSSTQQRSLGREALSLLTIHFRPVEGDVATIQKIHTSLDGTVKLLLKLSDGLEVETVLIPWEDRQSTTLCVSSQVGCLQGCQFCATSRMRKLRSLSCDEILAQLYFANKITRLMCSTYFPIDNVVYMGMGEPADNSEVVRATQIMTDRSLFGLTSRRVTISTVAPSPESFHELSSAPATLAWSVHSTKDNVRRRLVPTTKHSMTELRDGLIRTLQTRSKRLRSIMLEVVLLQDINDNEDDARHLAQFCRPILADVPAVKLVVNLIPWNDISESLGGFGSQFQSPSMDRVLSFQQVLMQEGLRCYVRTTRGDDTSAACGQLATTSGRRQRQLS